MATAMSCLPTVGLASSHFALGGLSASGSAVAGWLIRSIRDTEQPGSVSLTDGQNRCSELDAHRFVRHRTSPWAGSDSSHVVQPGVHLLESSSNVWFSGSRREELDSAHSDVRARRSRSDLVAAHHNSEGSSTPGFSRPRLLSNLNYGSRFMEREADIPGDGRFV